MLVVRKVLEEIIAAILLISTLKVDVIRFS